MRGAVRLLPELLCPGRAEERARRPGRSDLDSRRDCGRRALGRLRQVLLELRGRVGAVERHLDELGRDRCPDVVVLEQPRRRFRPVVGREQLPLRPDRQRADQRDQRRQHDQAPDEPCPLPAHVSDPGDRAGEGYSHRLGEGKARARTRDAHPDEPDDGARASPARAPRRRRGARGGPKISTRCCAALHRRRGRR